MALLGSPTAAQAESGPVSITDDLGRQVRLSAPAQRVVCLYGGLAETMAALGRFDALVARTQADRFPEAITDLPSVGTHMRPNLELIVGLAPDLVLQQAGRAEAVEVAGDLERLGIPVALFHPQSFAGLFSVMTRVGVLLGEDDQARTLVAGLEQRLADVDKALSGLDIRPLTAFEVRYPNLLLAGKNSMVSEIIQRAGGINPVVNAGNLARLSEEELLRLDPDVYLIQRGPMNPAPLPLDQRPLFRDLRAVRTGRILVVEEALYSRPGPRSVLAVEQLARFLHPERFPALTDTDNDLNKEQQ